LPGRIVSVAVALGARVKAGQTLTVLESIELGEARSAYLQAKSEAAVAEAALARAEKLVAEEIIPQKDYLRAKADAERARAGLRAATDKLRLLGVPASTLEKQQGDAAYPLVAPFAGTIIEKKAVPGELVQPDQALFTVADLTTVWLEADVFEKDLGKFAIGVPARIAVTAYPDMAFEGRLTYLGDTMDKTTRTVKARVEASNRDGRLKPGMFASAQLPSTATAKALLVPAQAVSLLEGEPTVFVEAATGFAPRRVTTGPTVDEMVEIKEGLVAGDRVVVAGAYALKARLLKSRLGAGD
jgi:membrane fusion protein, heavy metal efflux system